MQQLIPDNLTYTDVGDLPIIKHFAKQINLVDTINTMVKSQMQLQPGQAVLAMVLDTLSGRTPLYRLKEFFHEKDTELLLGTEIDTELFCDHNLGRVLDKIFDTGAQAIFSQLSPNAVKRFGIDTRDVHFDTTSISVYGDYELTDEPFKITLPVDPSPVKTVLLKIPAPLACYWLGKSELKPIEPSEAAIAE
jgi:hypothetical protein